MNKYLLVINAGSSSIKFAIYQIDTSLTELTANATGQIEGIGNQPNLTINSFEGLLLVNRKLSVNEVHDHTSAITLMLDWLRNYLADGTLLAVGHRVVHGGQLYSTPILINATVLTELETLVPLAPLHQPNNLAIIDSILKSMPYLPQVACFDTAFHRSQPDVAQRFAIPRRFTEEGVRPYGFHGLSYEYISTVLPRLDPKLSNARIIVAHLGSGASLCAIHHGQSIATTMGFSPLDGLMMGTRCGNIDPGVLLYFMDHHKMNVHTVEQLLYYQSGLLGVSGISSDMRTLLANDNPHAKEAIELFVYRIRREIGSLISALDGIDALVFTGGIGEHSPEIRSKICHKATWLDLELDDYANETSSIRISTYNSRISGWVVPTDENLVIANHTLQHVTF